MPAAEVSYHWGGYDIRTGYVPDLGPVAARGHT
jgi:hypothetical protein